ncbi:TonB-dependent siderophore receptor [Piscinibacter sp. HJYY11]|uniref:TonB-dependent receptor plug domain-containing protein n=1 Tax=Piscinibacter sp. HJYY11 TaxID=2801333 RepID=UPI00191D8A77|nr:TonB-dependent receptor [Piscinibacter sp. HJYY11]MBL0727271.1 TonB-dependent receptor [Piscinibacter sp. HJYY11]
MTPPASLLVRRPRLGAFVRWPLAAALSVGSAHAQFPGAAAIEDMSLEALANVPVTSVTGRPEALQRSAASIYVISGDELRRSGVSSLPEALRLAPNLQVARLNASQYAISARGFNNTIGNKLLVLIDGRTVYSPLFSGVFWDAQDVLLEDIDRIEVISGPGATLWGANAVNGVINVITKSATATQGAFAAASSERSGYRAATRYGTSVGHDTALRLYAVQSRRNETDAVSTGAPRNDDNTLRQAGFRADTSTDDHHLQLQGDIYDGGGDGSSNIAAELSGANLIAKLSSRPGEASNWQAQVYLDHTKRSDPVVFRDKTDTVDVTFNHAPSVDRAHKVLWGAGYRAATSRTEATPLVRFEPATRRLRWSHLFLQDEFAVSETLRVTAGVKLETNVYTGTEVLPTLRAAYDIGERKILWASLSRAVRSPARLDRDFYLPANPPHLIAGGPNFESEVANVAELGLRGQTSAASYSATAFLHDFDRLRAGRAGPTEIENRAWGKVWGLETWGTVDVAAGWRLMAGWVELRKSLHKDELSPASSIPNLGNDPRRQLQVRSTLDLNRRTQLDVSVRYVASLPEPHVPSYTAGNVRLGWRVTPALNASLYVNDLGRSGRTEFNASDASVIRSSAGIKVDWRLP